MNTFPMLCAVCTLYAMTWHRGQGNLVEGLLFFSGNGNPMSFTIKEKRFFSPTSSFLTFYHDLLFIGRGGGRENHICSKSSL